MNLTKQEKVLVLVVTLILIILINIISYYFIKYKLSISIYSKNYTAQQEKFMKTWQDGKKVHPFYGQADGNETGFKSDISVENNFVSVSSSSLLDQHVKVLVLGGSLASHLSLKREDVPEYLFAKKLNKYFKTDKFVIYNAAFGGGKQPQQYFKLLYLDFLGFKPDIIINYDGFNEIALPLSENLNRKLNAIYPRSFDQLVYSSTYEGECFGFNNFLLSFNSYIPLVEALKWYYVKYCHFSSVKDDPVKGFTNFQLFKNEEENYLQRTLLVWEIASNRINDFANRNSIPYMHFIQPNQYLKNSKVLTKLEKKEFFNYEPYFLSIRDHYKELDIQNLDTDLKFDQRYLFVNEPRTVYSDNCCHLNLIGMEAIIDDIIERGKNIFHSKLLNISNN